MSRTVLRNGRSINGIVLHFTDIPYGYRITRQRCRTCCISAFCQGFATAASYWDLESIDDGIAEDQKERNSEGFHIKVGITA